MRRYVVFSIFFVCRYVVSQFFHKVMKKLYMTTVKGSSGRDCVLIILFELYGSKSAFFKSNLFWVGHYNTPLNLHIGSRTNPILI